MKIRTPTLTLRDLFWLLSLAAIGIGWGVERNRAASELAKYPRVICLFNSGSMRATISEQRTATLAQLRTSTDEELANRLRGAAFDNEYACCLTEMARRGMHAELQGQYDELMTSPRSSASWGPENAELLTALRRAQCQPDPIKVHVELIDKDSEGRPKLINSIRPSLENVDVEQADVYLTNGGDDRSGREARWRVHFTNAAGVRVPDADFSGMGRGGGMFSFGPVKFGEKTFEDWLPLSDFVAPPPSGRYQMEVVYSEQVIADESNLDGLIVWKSDPVSVIVNNPPYQPWRISGLPLLVVFSVVAASYLLVRTRRQRQGLTPIGTRRDRLAAGLVLSLTLVWVLDVAWLNLRIDHLRPESSVEWTIKLAD